MWSASHGYNQLLLILLLGTFYYVHVQDLSKRGALHLFSLGDMGTIRIKRSVTNWIRLKLNSPRHKKQSEEMEVDKLEDTLMNNWRELERMLVCSKVSFCANRYKKNFQIGHVNVMANLIQSLTITLYHIKDITSKLRKLKDTQ